MMIFLEAIALISLIFTTMMVVAQFVMMRRTLFPIRPNTGEDKGKVKPVEKKPTTAKSDAGTKEAKKSSPKTTLSPKSSKTAHSSRTAGSSKTSKTVASSKASATSSARASVRTSAAGSGKMKKSKK